MGDVWPRHEALKCIHISLLCVQEAAADRPKLPEVVMMLNGYTISSSMPSKPAFFISKESDDSVIWGGNSGIDIGSTPAESSQSVNGVTITELQPRD